MSELESTQFVEKLQIPKTVHVHILIHTETF